MSRPFTIDQLKNTACANLNGHIINEPVKKKNKYGAKKVIIDGYVFDSTKEGGRYLELKMMQRAGLICDLKLQVKFLLIEKSEGQRKCEYKADFTYLENETFIVEDTKGVQTEGFKIKMKLMKEKHGIDIRIS